MNDKASEILINIGEKLISSLDNNHDGWAKAFIRIERFEGEKEYSFFYYSANSSEKSFFVIDNEFEFYDLVDEFDEATRAPDGRQWKVCLFSANSETSEFDAEFEFDDSARWGGSDVRER